MSQSDASDAQAGRPSWIPYDEDVGPANSTHGAFADRDSYLSSSPLTRDHESNPQESHRHTALMQRFAAERAAAASATAELRKQNKRALIAVVTLWLSVPAGHFVGSLYRDFSTQRPESQGVFVPDDHGADQCAPKVIFDWPSTTMSEGPAAEAREIEQKIKAAYGGVEGDQVQLTWVPSEASQKDSTERE